jgi:hypothetical protein
VRPHQAGKRPALRKAIIMTTLATQSHHHKVPIAAGLAVAGLIAAGGVLGVAWEANHNSSTVHNVPAVQPIPSGEYWKTPQYHPLQYQPRIIERGYPALGGVDGHVPPAPPVAPQLYGGHVVDGQ